MYVAEVLALLTSGALIKVSSEVMISRAIQERIRVNFVSKGCLFRQYLCPNALYHIFLLSQDIIHFERPEYCINSYAS